MAAGGDKEKVSKRAHTQTILLTTVSTDRLLLVCSDECSHNTWLVFYFPLCSFCAYSERKVLSDVMGRKRKCT